MVNLKNGVETGHLGIKRGVSMQIFKVILLHILYVLGLVLLYSPPLGIIDDKTYLTWEGKYMSFHLAFVGFFVLFVWALLIFFFYKRTILVVIEGIVGFFFTALAARGASIELLTIMEHPKQIPPEVDIFATFFNITMFSILLAPFLSNWWKRKREKIIVKWKKQ